MSWLLDTDVICQPAKKNGDAKVIAWLESEQDASYTSAVVIAQLESVIFAGLGDKDRCFAALDRAASAGPYRIGWALAFPDTRFSAPQY